MPNKKSENKTENTPANSNESSTVSTSDQQQNNQEQERQNQAGFSWKRFVMQMVIFYFISNLFKSGSKPNATNGTTSQAASYKPSTNLFPRGQLLVSHLLFDHTIPYSNCYNIVMM